MWPQSERKSGFIDFQTDKNSGQFKRANDKTPTATRNATEARQEGSKPSRTVGPASFGGTKHSG